MRCVLKIKKWISENFQGKPHPHPTVLREGKLMDQDEVDKEASHEGLVHRSLKTRLFEPHFSITHFFLQRWTFGAKRILGTFSD